MPGPEAYLMKALPAAIRDELPINDTKYLRYRDPHLHAYLKHGSLNFGPMANATWLWHRGAEEALEWWIKFFKRDRAGYWRDYEINSRMKTPWTFTAVWSLIDFILLNMDNFSDAMRPRAKLLLVEAQLWCERQLGLWSIASTTQPDNWQTNRRGRRWRNGPCVWTCGPRSDMKVFAQNMIDDTYAECISWPGRWSKRRPEIWTTQVIKEGRKLNRRHWLTVEKKAALMTVTLNDISQPSRWRRALNLVSMMIEPGTLRSIVNYAVVRYDTGVITWMSKNPNRHSRPCFAMGCMNEVPWAIIPRMKGEKRPWPAGQVIEEENSLSIKMEKGEHKLNNRILLPKTGKQLYRFDFTPQGGEVYYSATFTGKDTPIQNVQYEGTTWDFIKSMLGRVWPFKRQ
jgi:hypothetical protein